MAGGKQQVDETQKHHEQLINELLIALGNMESRVSVGQEDIGRIGSKMDSTEKNLTDMKGMEKSLDEIRTWIEGSRAGGKGFMRKE